MQQHEGLTLLHAALGQAQVKAGHIDEALATFQRAAELFPRNVPVTVRYAETLMAAGHPAEAHDMLLDLFNNVPPTPDQIRLTALAASAAGDPGDAYYYMGEYQIAGGDLNLAAQQLQLALAAPHLSQIQRERYQARLDEVREYLASTRKRQLSSDNNDGSGQGQARSAATRRRPLTRPRAWRARLLQCAARPLRHVAMRADTTRASLSVAVSAAVVWLRDAAAGTSATRAIRGSA